jgi:hypothetical protein
VSLRSFSSQSSPSERVPGRKEECTTCGENHNRKRRSTSRFRFLFVPISRPFCVHPNRVAYTVQDVLKPYPTSTVDTTTAIGRPVRFFCLVRTTTATRPARFCARYDHPLSRTRFPRMTIAQRTTLSNQLRLCRIQKHSRCRGRLQRHVRLKQPSVLPLTTTHRDA